MKRRFTCFFTYAAFFILNLHFASASFYLADHGTDVRTSSGALLEAGNLTIQIWDNMTGGRKIYENNFTNAIINGSWNVRMLLSLEYGNLYYKDYKINGEDLDFNNNERLAFTSPLGMINNPSLINFSLIGSCPSGSSIRKIYENGNVECEHKDVGMIDTKWNINGSKYLQNNSGIMDINDSQLDAFMDLKLSGFRPGGWSNNSANTTTSLNAVTSGNISAASGLFRVLGSSTQMIAVIFAQNIDVSELNILGNIRLNGIAIDDWSDISAGKSAGGYYLYNDSSRIYLNETRLNEAISSKVPSSSGEGWINDSVKTTTSLNVAAAGNISTSSYGFFGWLGSFTKRVAKIFAQDMDLSGNLKVSGGITLNEKTIGDWKDISSGKYAGGNYLYNDSSRIYLDEAKLNSTIILIHSELSKGEWVNNSANESTSLNIVTIGNISASSYGFFSWIGSPDQRVNDISTKNLDVSGNLILNGVAINDWSDIASGNGKSGGGLYLYNDSKYIYFNETRLNNSIDSRSSSGATIWQNGAWVSLGNAASRDVNISNLVFIKGSSGNVGINTISPSDKLDVSGSFRVLNSSGKSVFFVNSRSGSTSLRRIAGISATPSVSAGTGAGDSASISIEGTDIGGEILLTTGTGVSLPTDANIFNVGYSAAFPVDSYVVISPANSNAAMLSGASAPHVNANSAGFSITSGTTGLNPATTYIWEYIVVGR